MFVHLIHINSKVIVLLPILYGYIYGHRFLVLSLEAAV